MVSCPYCGNPAERVRGSVVYPSWRAVHSRWFWRCAPCDAHVGCHDAGTRGGVDYGDGTVPLGRLADARLRRLRSRAHAEFDPLWQDGAMRRREAYAWLAGQLRIDVGDCHIGDFDEAQCQAVIDACMMRKIAAI